MWEIKGKNNEVKAIPSTKPEYNGIWMKECYVTVNVESPTPVNFEIGDYIIYRDERFEINYDPGKIKSAPRYEKGDAFKYENIKFNSLADELTRCDFRDLVLQDNNLHFTSLPKFPFYGGVRDLANRIQANLDKLYTGANKWTVIVSPEFQDDKELNVQIDNIKVQGALEILVNQFETYYTISGRTITIGAAGIPAGHLFKYGKGNGLYEIEQNAEADQAIVTRLRAYGSTRNLPHRYYNSLSGADGKKLIPDNMAVQYLMLPEFPYTTQDPYIDSPNIAKLGIREDSVFFDGSGELEEIYPSIEGMTAEQLKAAGVPCNSTGALDEIVSAEQMTDNGVGEINEGETQTTAKPPTFKVTVKDLGFDINDHLTTETATLSFKTGMLGGRNFEIVKNGCKPIKDASDKVTGYELELNRVYDDDIKLWFPYSAYNAQAGDKFVLLYIEMPEVYIKAAAQRLKEAATEWLSKNDYSRSIYAPKVDEIFMARQHDLAMASGGKIKSLHDTLKEGMLLLFEDEDLNIDASIFIDRLTIKEEGTVPTYEVVLKEEKTVGRLDKMQNQIDSLVAGKGQGGGGYTAAQIRSMIEAYGDTRFLSKLKDDRSQGQIASDMAIEVGDFLAGVSGAKIGKDAETGQTFGEMDRLFIRIKAYFETLTIINADSLAGEQRITPGGGVKCTSVETLDNVYRCYFLSEQDGEKTETKIIAGDQAIAQMFNAKIGISNKVSNHRYWRLVTAVNNDAYTDDSGNRYGYIDLSKADCEKGSDIPQAGDTIVQFGNRNDHTRQAAMVFSTVAADAPSIKLLTGIDSYTLAGKDIVSYGYDPVKGNAYFNCYGDTYIGDPDGSTFIRYDRATKQLDIKAKFSVQSTFGDQTFEQWLTDHGYTDDTVANEALDAANDALITANATKSEIDKYKYLANALQQDTQISGGLMMTTLISLGYTDAGNMRHTLAGMNGSWIPELGGRTIASWYGGEMTDLFDANDNRLSPAPSNAATSLIRMDGSAYWANGNIGFRADGSGWLGNKDNGIKFSSDGSMTFGSGIKININSVSGLGQTLTSITNFQNSLSNLLVPINSSGKEISWEEATQSDGAGGIKAKGIMAKVHFSSQGSVAAKGLPTGIGGSEGGGTSYDRLDAWTDYTADAAGWVLSAKLGYGLYLTQNSLLTRVAALEATPGLDTAALEQYLTTNNYAKLSDIPAAVDLSPYAKKADVVTALGVSGNNLTWTKNGVVNSITVPYATAASNLICSGETADLNSSTLNRNGLYWWQRSTQHNPNSGWGVVLQWSNGGYPEAGKEGHWITQLASGTNNVLYCRTITNTGSWTGWRTILDSANYASVLGNVYQPKGNYVTTDTAQTITGAKTFTGEVIATSKWITARIITGEDGSANNTAQRKKAHSIELGYPNRDYMNFNEFGGVFNFYKTQDAYSSTGDGILVAQISPAGVKSTAFIKDGGTSAQFLKADGSVDSLHYVRALDGTEVDGAVNLNEIWNNATAIGSVAASANGPAENNGRWYNVIQIAHRNGKGDGPSYVGQIALGMTVAQDSMYFRGHRTRAWQHVLTSSNYTSALDSRYVKKSGDTMTGLFSAPHISVAGMYWNNTGIMPADAGNNLYTCGKPTGRWSNVYATTINVTSTALVANLNADLLDGIQGVNYGYAARIGNFTVGSSRANITTAQFITKLTSLGAFGRAHWTVKCSWSYAGNDTITDSGVGNIELAGAVIEVISNHASEYTIRVTTSPTTANGGVPNAVFIYRNHGSGYVPNWKRLANTSDNVSSATKLATARTIWGRPFDGTQNITGDLVNVGTITGTSNQYALAATYSDTWSDGTNRHSWYGLDHRYGNTGIYSTTLSDYYGLSLKTRAGLICMTHGGEVGINTANPAYPLDVAGSAIFSNWVRVRNNDGIYFENHGGGWHMSDNAWVRLYGGKALYCGYGEVRTDALFNREEYVGASWGQGYGAYNVAIANNGSQTPLMVAYRAGQLPSVTGANRLFAIELLNSGSELRFSFGGRASFQLWSNGNLHVTGSMWSDKAVSGKGLPSSSDERLKTDIRSTLLSMEMLLNAPSVSFLWIDELTGPRRAGTIAQYWLHRLPEVVYMREDNGMYNVDYGPLAHIEVISLAHHVDDELTQLKRRVTVLERRIKKLKKLLNAA